METVMGPLIDDATRALLGDLANALVPLSLWVDTKPYVPPAADKLPWRQGEALTTDRLRVVDFFVALLRESSSDEALLERWTQLRAKPLQYSPHERPDDWRRLRGLDVVPLFGVIASENVLTDPQGRHVARTRFYSDYLPLLRAAADARKPASQADWSAFAFELFTDRCLQWPGGQPPSSAFVTQFVRDVLYAILGMRNPIEDPWFSAVLTELGEFRRPGNAYTRDDVARGLKELRSVLASYPPSDTTKVGLVASADIDSATRAHYLDFRQRRL
jgi:hypothetical protein